MHAVVVAEQRERVGGAQFQLVRDDVDLRVKRAQTRARGCGLAGADVGGVEQQLALQVGQVDAVVIDDAQRADAGRGQVQAGRRTEAAGADHQYARGLEFFLAGDADLRQQQVAAVALAIVRGRVSWRHLAAAQRTDQVHFIAAPPRLVERLHFARLRKIRMCGRMRSCSSIMRKRMPGCAARDR